MLNSVKSLVSTDTNFSSLVYVMHYVDFQLFSQPSTHGVNVILPILNFDEKFNSPISPSVEKFMDSAFSVKSNSSS